MEFEYQFFGGPASYVLLTKAVCLSYRYGVNHTYASLVACARIGIIGYKPAPLLDSKNCILARAIYSSQP